VLDDVTYRGAGLDWKTSLQELMAGGSLGVPLYQVSESGPDHQKTFIAVAVVGGEQLGSGAGRSKKEAEQRAAEAAFAVLRARSEPTPASGSPID
jgi:ribonuclease-3